MRGDVSYSAGMFSYIGPEERIVPPDHPLRPFRDMVDTTLRELSLEFARLSPEATGRPWAPAATSPIRTQVEWGRPGEGRIEVRSPPLRFTPPHERVGQWSIPEFPQPANEDPYSA